jgi:hypothetical protein
MNNKSQDTKSEVVKKKQRTRLPYLFPAYNFNLARQIAEVVEKDGAGILSEETLAIALHLSAKSSGFQLKTLTARQFGLLTKQAEMLSSTPLAKSIFKPTTEPERNRALTESFLAIPLFREVANRFRGQPLPQGQAFRNVLEREFGIESKRVSDAERVLIESARETGVLVTSGSNTYLSTERKGGEKKESESTPVQQTPSTQPLNPVSTARPAYTPTSGILTISEEDLAGFSDDEEFKEIWGALGKIVRARGKKLLAEQDIANDEGISTKEEK